MKKLLILSGKGGTGKTTVASAFIGFSNAKAYADCDVDAPNLHLATKQNGDIIQSNFFGMAKAYINKDKCISCGLCEKNCKFDSIRHNDKFYEIIPIACEGCGVCEYVCPSKAITMVEDVAGQLKLTKGEKVFSTAQLKMGSGNSGKLVSQVKMQLDKNANANTHLAIIDGSPGIGCPVIASISGIDLALLVSEPSISGLSDLKRIVDTCKNFKVEVAVCVNKWDTQPEITEKIQDYCNQNQLNFVGNIPYDKCISYAIDNGINVSQLQCQASFALKNIYNEVIKLLK